MTDTTGLDPLKLFEYDHKPGHFSLLLTDSSMIASTEAFEAAGFEGGGYSWAGVAKTAIEVHAPHLDGRMGFDPEAGMFVAYGTDPEALRELGLLLRRALGEPEFLAELIAAGDPAAFD
ncbi:hypothetical protein F4553_002316 [Allocatelliglobosispora scoriae]|uniref:Immunity protein 51 of polymorphic toxin system n=1 Tax=Allocatelliglobosispora scoriae TaxID=643052 RepID=A0A841BII9_9ACTN|nr:Imm51 family immunity protein [Allocatelliglobosispora scoriae]MBB5868937.1 hypothetical protein [Allocatelliglobosispora scoriae]